MADGALIHTVTICRGSWYRALIDDPSGRTINVGYARQYVVRWILVTAAELHEIFRAGVFIL